MLLRTKDVMLCQVIPAVLKERCAFILGFSSPGVLDREEKGAKHQ